MMSNCRSALDLSGVFFHQSETHTFRDGETELFLNQQLVWASFIRKMSFFFSWQQLFLI